MSDKNGATGANGSGGLRLKIGLAEMLKGGVIMDVMSAAQARVAEEAGARHRQPDDRGAILV